MSQEAAPAAGKALLPGQGGLQNPQLSPQTVPSSTLIAMKTPKAQVFGTMGGGQRTRGAGGRCPLAGSHVPPHAGSSARAEEPTFRQEDDVFLNASPFIMRHYSQAGE